MPPVPAIVLQGLSRRFGDRVAVAPLAFDVMEGEMFGLVGPDGCGKTTTVRMLCGVLAPDAGTAQVLGADVVREPDRVKRTIGYLSQRFSLYGDLTVDENIEFFAGINGVRDFQPRREELLEFTRLTAFRTRLAENLSGGMKQKLALACTLVHTPRLLLLDEPTTGVDPVSRRDFWRILQSLQSTGITIVMSTPYLDEAERCTRIALMNEGSAMLVDTPAAIRARMNGEVVELVCGQVQEAVGLLRSHRATREVHAFGDRLHAIVGRAQQDAPILEEVLRGAGIAVQGWRVVSPSLENVFISLLSRRNTLETGS